MGEETQRATAHETTNGATVTESATPQQAAAPVAAAAKPAAAKPAAPKARPHRGYPKQQRSAEETEKLTEELLESLKARYGDRMPDVLEAALILREITYDDYIETPTLLSLQQTLTDFHDELIFKVYHQQTELWFRLVLHEIERGIRSLVAETPSLAIATEAARRLNRYFAVLANSYSVMLHGLSSEEFLIYRKAFGTSSGFQSSQFRAIEILAGMDKERGSGGSIESRPKQERTQMQKQADEQAEFYWERAARHITTNAPTLTLVKFKEQHLKYLNDLYQKRTPFSFRLAFLKVAEDMLGHYDDPVVMMEALLQSSNKELILLAEELLKMDDSIVEWKVAHLKVAAKHLARAPKGTGETNWAEYLAESIREQRCFPELQSVRLKVEQSSAS